MTDAELTELLRPFTGRGDQPYNGGPISVLEHSLQCAHMAEESGVSSAEIVAALLHDVGHLLPRSGGTAPGDPDTHYEQLACEYLAHWYEEDVLGPVRLHVAAKRYLAATEKGYLESLPAGSRASLSTQGGVMFGEELASFLRSPFAEAAVRLRRWHDAAHLSQVAVPDLDHYDRHLKTAARPASSAVR